MYEHSANTELPVDRRPPTWRNRRSRTPPLRTEDLRLLSTRGTTVTARFGTRTAAETDWAILDLVRSTGVVSRVQLAERSGLTGASISRTVKRLLDARLLTEIGPGDSTGGKRPTLLELNARGRFAVGLSVDESQLTYVLIDLRGQVVGELTSPGIGHIDPQVVVHRMAAEIDELIKRCGLRHADVAGVGVGVAGRLDTRGVAMRGSLRTTNWEQFALEVALERAVGLPVTLEHDYVSAALGEFWVGKVPATANFACFYMATGFGCGILLEGDVYRGSSHNAGEIGHLSLGLDGPPCWCGSRGCLEAYAGPRSVLSRALDQADLAERLELTGDEVRLRAEFGRVARAAMAGDAQCLALIEESARYVAAAVLSLSNVLDLDRIVLSGPGFADAAPIYARVARSAIERLSFMREVHPITFELSLLGLRSAAIGSATVALHRSSVAPTVRETTRPREPDDAG
jgi:predicted NBD/HSP70 family sugar kinase